MACSRFKVTDSPDCQRCWAIASQVVEEIRGGAFVVEGDGQPMQKGEVIKTVSPCFVVRSATGWWTPVCEAVLIKLEER